MSFLNISLLFQGNNVANKVNGHLCLNTIFFIKVTNSYAEYNVIIGSCSFSLCGVTEARSVEEEAYSAIVHGEYFLLLKHNMTEGT